MTPNMRHSFNPIQIWVVFVFCSFVPGFSAQAQGIWQHLQENDVELQAVISRHDPERNGFLVQENKVSLKSGAVQLNMGDGVWQVELKEQPQASSSEKHYIQLLFRLLKGKGKQLRLAISLQDNRWTRDCYLLLPAAAYNGNRFDYRRIAYSPKLLDPRDIGPNIPILVSDIPKLNAGDGPSRIQDRSGALSAPVMAWFNPGRQSGQMLWFEQGNKLGDYGIQVEENQSRSKAWFSISSPVVREGYKYRITDNRYPSTDQAADFNEGDSLVVSATYLSFPCSSVQGLFDRFFSLRPNFGPHEPAPKNLTYSQAFRVQEHKFNTQNFVKDPGYYSVGMRENFLQDWQIGWTGGMISTYPLLVLGHDSTRKNVLKNFKWLFENGIAPSGFFWDSGEKGKFWYGGDIRKPHTKNWHLVRKSGDGLFFVLKQFAAMVELGIKPEAAWLEKSKGVAQAFVHLWEKNGQLGQFIDNETAEIRVGGSTSGAIVPAALVLAHRQFADGHMLQVAGQIGDYFYREFVQKGFQTGGPGDALQNPDSESCYALIESYMYLYEATRQEKWLQYAREVTAQFASWVSSYNYRFPNTSLFGKIGIHSSGAVWANTQNKHGAPGICTHSGLGLLKLYIATGDTLVLRLLQDISQNMTQYIGTPSRPIPGVKPGWVCERVSTTDWLEGIGEITYQSTWAETSLMLTHLEIPGLLIEPARNKITSFDQVVGKSIGKGKYRIENPTKSACRVWYWVAAKGKWPEEGKWQADKKWLELKPGEARVLTVEK